MREKEGSGAVSPPIKSTKMNQTLLDVYSTSWDIRSRIIIGFSLKLHQISHWQTGNQQPKAVCFRPHYLPPQTVQLLSFTEKKFLPLFLHIEFADQSHLNQCSQQEQQGIKACFGTDSCSYKHTGVKYYAKEQRKEAREADSWKML